MGAGSAGWMAANHLGSMLSADEDIEITVIESADVPTIGVGEGTVPYIMNGLKRFGISEAEFLVSCDTTFKQGIKFVNWLDLDTHGENHYYHPFHPPYPSNFDISPYWVAHASDEPFENVSIQAKICEAGLAPKKKSSLDYEGALSYAYHFNAGKFAELLAKNAQTRFNVKHLFATVTGAKRDEQGNISHLINDAGEELAYDFYVDCSGFASILLGGELNVNFLSKSSEILTDTAMVQQMPLADNEDIKPYTTATAHKAGWIWDIPLTTRRGTGFVYSSQHMGDEEATRLYADYLGLDADTFAPRKIPMKIGYREKFWANNCVALGLAQGFVEPLEATSIFLTDFSAELLAKNFPGKLEDMEALAPYFNKVTTYAWDRVIDFIKLHYYLSDRKDSDFWEENRREDRISDELKERLDKFRLRPPQQSDFYTRFDMFDEKNFLYVLYGMKFSTNPAVLSKIEIERSGKLFSENEQLAESTSKELLKHRDWLEGLKRAVDAAQARQNLSASNQS